MSLSTIRKSLVRLVLLGLSMLLALCGSNTKGEIVIDEGAGEVRFPARTQISAFSRDMFQPGHHYIVSADGVSRFGALFNALVNDLDIRHALESIGAVPGENLLVETWNEREDPNSSAPDLRVEGSAIDVMIEYEGNQYRFDDLIRTSVESEALHDTPLFRYGGNEQFRDDFHSGCVVCNYSCPGGAIGNHNATIRDETRERITFSVIEPFPIPDDAVVTVVLSPILE